MTRRRRDFLGSSFFLTLFILFPTLGLAIPSFSADLSDREEDGLLGDVRSVETRESLLVQTDRYDPVGRLIERVQDGVETSQGLWPLRFVYTYDQAGRRTAEVVQDARGAVVKETRSVYDDRGNRSAELAAWGDGTFENVSLYEYDEAHRRIRGLHFNGVQVINRNLYAFDSAGRLVRERFERNYHYDAAGTQVVMTDRFDTGYEVAIVYDEQGHVREKVVSDLRSRHRAVRSFATTNRAIKTKNASSMPRDRPRTAKSTATNTTPWGIGSRKRFSGGPWLMAARRSSNPTFASAASSTTNPRHQCLFQALWCLYATASSWQAADEGMPAIFPQPMAVRSCFSIPITFAGSAATGTLSGKASF
jgi:hypothetical protein